MSHPHQMPSYKPNTPLYAILHDQWSRSLETAQVISECNASGFKIDSNTVTQFFMLFDARMEKEIGGPIPMILHCPSCHAQHIDKPDAPDAHCFTLPDGDCVSTDPRCMHQPHPEPAWTNPPHRSHLCHQCGSIWRPADVPTEGVAEIKTRGKKDVIRGGIVNVEKVVASFNARSEMEAAMTIQQLRSQVDHQRNTVSRAINVLEQVKIAIDEGDTDEALRLITEATA